MTTKTTKKPLKVSDHALVRYMERVQKIDVEKLKRYILTEEVASAIKSGASSITT